MTDLSIHPLVLSGYGLVEASFERTVDRFGSHAQADQSQVRVVNITSSAAEALDYLSLRTHPATRLVLVDRGSWTAVLTSHRYGSDFSDYQYWAAHSLGVRTVRVVDSEARWWTRDKLRERLAYEARILELHAPDDSTVRSIACADDGGHWVFETSGSPLPIEASFDYDAPRKKDRFTRSNLHAMLTDLGPGPLTAATFLEAPRFGLLAERWTNDAWRTQIEAAACSLEEADDPAFGYYQVGMSYVDYLDTHATSVIASFERAIAINPAYEPRVRDYLRQARRIAGN